MVPLANVGTLDMVNREEKRTKSPEHEAYQHGGAGNMNLVKPRHQQTNSRGSVQGGALSEGQ
jgi:hypothetical protein